MKGINPKALVTILIMFCLNLGAQDLSKKMLFKHVGPKEGLAKLNLQNALVDQQGILWISTTNGLYSYDGISILLHKSSTFGKNILSNNRITGLLEDRSGQLWCGSESLCKYDPCSKKWSCFFVTIKQGKLLMDYIFPFYIDIENKVWCYIGKYAGIGYFDPLTETFQEAGIKAKNIVPLSNKNSFYSKLDSIWCFDQKDKLTLHTLLSKNKWQTKEFTLSLNNESLGLIYDLKVDDQKTWICSANGLYKLNVYQNVIEKIDLSDIQSNIIPSSVSFVNDYALISTFNHGLIVLNSNNNKIVNYIPNDENNSINSNSFINTYLDQFNNLYCLYKGGVDICNLDAENFEFIPFPNKMGIEEKYILASCTLDEIVICDYLENYYKLNTKNNEIIKLSEIKKSKLIQTKNKNFAFCNSTNTVLPYGIFNIKENNYCRQNISPKSIFSSKYQDSSILLLSEFDLYKLNYKTDELYKIATPRDITLSYPSILSVFPNHDIILATYSGYIQSSLLKDSLITKQIIKNHIGNFVSMAHSNIPNKVFLATNFEVYLYDYQKMIIDSIIFPKSKKSKVNISSIAMDHANALWIATSLGIVKIENGGTETLYNSSDLIPSENFISSNILVHCDSFYYIGTPEGVIKFKPNELKKRVITRPVQINNFKVNDSLYSQFNYLKDTQEIKLKSQENFFSLEGIVVDLYQADQYLIEFKLNGIDKEWITEKNGSIIRYSNLPFGIYNFLIRGQTKDLKTITQVKSINITILPPWYLTWWFQLLMSIVLLFIFFLVYLFWKNRILEKQRIEFEKKQIVEDERLRIARDMHDDLGSSLSALNLISGNLKQSIKEELNLSQHKDLEKIHSLSERLNQNIREIIWTTNSSNDNMESLILYLHRFVLEIKTLTNRKINIKIPAQYPNIELSASTRKKIYLICKEALHNALKHTNGSINLRIELLNQNQFSFVIEDDGPGFIATESISKGGNGLLNMKSRAESILNTFLVIESNVNSNTKVSLNIKF